MLTLTLKREQSKMSRSSEERTLVDSFETLTRIPSPDISEHPASSGNANAKTTVADDRPNLITTSSPVQIRSWAEDRARIDAEFRQRPDFDPYRNYDRVRSDFILAPVEGRNAFAASAINLSMNNSFRSRPLVTEPPKSPFIATPRGIIRRTKRNSDESDKTVLNMKAASFSQLNINHRDWADTEATTDRISTSLFRPKTPSKGFKASTTPISETFDTKKSGLRKVTGLFKQKAEKTLDTTPPPAPTSSPEDSFFNQTAHRFNTVSHSLTGYLVKTNHQFVGKASPLHPELPYLRLFRVRPIATSSKHCSRLEISQLEMHHLCGCMLRSLWTSMLRLQGCVFGYEDTQRQSRVVGPRSRDTRQHQHTFPIWTRGSNFLAMQQWCPR